MSTQPESARRADIAERLLQTAPELETEIATLRAQLATLRAELAAAKADGARLDWLEAEASREELWRNHEGPLPHSLFRRNLPITRAAIDAARSPSPDTNK